MQTPNSNKGDNIAAVSSNTATTTTNATSSSHKTNIGSFDDIIQHSFKFDYDTDTSTKDDRSCSTSKTDDSTTETEHSTTEEKFKMVTAITSTPVVRQALIDHFCAILPHCTRESIDGFLDSLEMVHLESERDHLVSQLTFENGLLRFNEQADGKLVVPSKSVKLEKDFGKRIKLRGSNWKWKVLTIGMSNEEKWDHALTKFKKYMTDLDIVYFYPGHPRVGDTVLSSLREILRDAVEEGDILRRRAVLVQPPESTPQN